MRGCGRAAMFGGLFLRPSVFLNGGSNVHHQIGTKVHVGGFGRACCTARQIQRRRFGLSLFLFLNQLAVIILRWNVSLVIQFGKKC